MDRKDCVIGRWLIVAFELEWNGWIMGGMMIASAMEHVSCASVGLVLSPLCACLSNPESPLPGPERRRPIPRFPDWTFIRDHPCWFSFPLFSIHRQGDAGVYPDPYSLLSSSLSIQPKTTSGWPRHRKQPVRQALGRERTQSCHGGTLRVKSLMANISSFSMIECSRSMRGSNFTREETSLLNTWLAGMRRMKSMRTVSEESKTIVTCND